jgi:hypothetical protein
MGEMSNENTTDPPVACDRAPQPASQPMSEATARFYTELTHGQLTAFQHPDGNWYLSAPQPPDASVEPGGSGVCGS